MADADAADNALKQYAGTRDNTYIRNILLAERRSARSTLASNRGGVNVPPADRRLILARYLIFVKIRNFDETSFDFSLLRSSVFSRREINFRFS